MRSPDPRKGLDDLIAAAAGLPGDVRLVLAGRTGAGSEAVRRAAADARVEVVFPGYLDDATLAAAYRGASAVAVPSRHEGFGLTALEAMACGAPVVGTTGGNLRSLAEGAALLVDVGDRAGLTTALRTVLDDGSAAGRLRAAGIARAASFTWPAAAERTAAVYRSVLAAGRSRH